MAFLTCLRCLLYAEYIAQKTELLSLSYLLIVNVFARNLNVSESCTVFIIITCQISCLVFIRASGVNVGNNNLLPVAFDARSRT